MSHYTQEEVKRLAAKYDLIDNIEPLTEFANAIAAESANQQDVWQPIETAPKGVLISVWIDWKNGREECWLYCYYDTICGEWRTASPSNHLMCVPERFVTHWMPNPQPQNRT